MAENTSQSMGKVVLVGAGPGDPGLISVKGMRHIEDCDVLVYDSLTADEFVALSNAKKKLFVGKAASHHSVPQEEINQILVNHAKAGRKVVRLKGGDPFVFGRGGEECLELFEAGIQFEIVPGVTSGIAGTAYAGVPVTFREMARGVTLITGHFAKDKDIELNWKALASLGHTLVFYMSVKSMPTICAELIEAGMDKSTPAMMVEDATTGSQREVVATLETLPEASEKAKIHPPALFVVGDCIGLREKLQWLPERPLAGKSVLFTRAAESQYEAVERLRGLGAEVLDVPVVSSVGRKGDPAVKKVLSALDEFECIAFTSAIGVAVFFKEMWRMRLDCRHLARHTIAAGSKSVIEALEVRGVIPDCVPEKGGMRSLADALLDAGLAHGAKILLPRSSAADESLPKRLRKKGFTPSPLPIYDSAPVNLAWLDVKLTNWKPDAVFFLSGTGVDAIAMQAGHILEGEAKPIIASVGKKTAEALEAKGYEADVIPPVPDVDKMVQLVIERLMDDPS